MPSRRELLWIKEGKKCHWCGQPTRLTIEDAWDQATTDHVLPRYKGGGSEDANLVSACKLCNNRRSHEDQRGLPDGHLLGNYSPGNSKKVRTRYVALTGDEKNAIKAGKPAFHAVKSVSIKTEDLLKDQRDQALREIGKLRTENASLKGQVENFKQKLRTMTFRKLLLIRVARWLAHSEK